LKEKEKQKERERERVEDAVVIFSIKSKFCKTVNIFKLVRNVKLTQNALFLDQSMADQLV